MSGSVERVDAARGVGHYIAGGCCAGSMIGDTVFKYDARTIPGFVTGSVIMSLVQQRLVLMP